MAAKNIFSEQFAKYLLDTRRPVSPRHIELVRLTAIGKTNAEVAETLQMTKMRTTILLSNSHIQKEIAQFKINMLPLDQQLEKTAHLALDSMMEMLDSPHVSTRIKLKIAKWILEKHLGQGPAEPKRIAKETYSELFKVSEAVHEN